MADRLDVGSMLRLDHVHKVIAKDGSFIDLNNNKDILDKMDIVDESLATNAIKSAKDNTFESSAKSIYKVLGEVYGK